MSQPQQKSGFSPSKTQIIAGVLAVSAVIFIAQNSKKGTLRFLFLSWTAPVWIALLFTLVIGAVIGYVARGLLAGRKLAKREAERRADPTVD